MVKRFPRLRKLWTDSGYNGRFHTWAAENLPWDVEIVKHWWTGVCGFLVAPVLRPDVVLMDIKMPLMDGIEATRLIRNEHPSCQVLVLTTFDDDAYIIEALEAGAAGYLLKTIPAQELVQAIRAAHSHMYLFDRTLAGKVVAALRDAARLCMAQDLVPPISAKTDIPKELTSRKLEVLRLVAGGASNREIAVALVISESTVKAHISSLLSRLGLRDHTQAALYARDKGWLW